MDTVEELGQEIAGLSAHLDAAAHRLLECIRHFDEARGWHEQGALSCAHWLAWRLGWDPATAREKVRELVLEPDEADLILRATERAREVHARQAEPLETEAAGATCAVGAPAASAVPAAPAAQGEAEAAEAAGASAEACWPPVHLDQEVLGPYGAWAATLEDGSRVSAEALRRVACDCGLVAIGGDGEALNIGRRAAGQ